MDMKSIAYTALIALAAVAIASRIEPVKKVVFA